MQDLAMFRLRRTTPTERLEKTIKPFVSNAPEVLALAESLGLAIKGIEYVNRNGSPTIFRGRLSGDSTQSIHEEGQI